MSEDVLLGRNRELEAGTRLFDLIRSGGAAACLIDGEPGIGKTTVWGALHHAGRDVGLRVLTARPVEAEAAALDALRGAFTLGIWLARKDSNLGFVLPTSEESRKSVT